MSDQKYNALVVGAGISGIRAALDLAQQDCRVALIDKSPAMGGLLNQLDFQFPSTHCGMCKMLPLVHRDRSSQFCLRKGLFHENIDLMLSTELSDLAGEPGNFAVKLHQRPTWVDPGRCVGCGLCESVCPETVPDCFNEGLSSHKAIYLPVPHAIPNAYVIDLAACSRCGACEEICPTDAVTLSQSNRKNFNILVVDDELSIRDSLKEWLEDEAFTVDMAASGAEALEKLKAQTYQLMLTDIKMPEMSGTALLQKAKQAYPDLCVVMMTAYATVETAVEAMKTGAEDYLIKPFNPDTLVPMVILIYQDIEAARDREITVDTVILATGTSFYDPADEKNIYGYGIYPNVLTGIEFERMISHSGPGGGGLNRLDNGRPVQKIAWIQCVGSRDIQHNADFCSSICCMAAIKEAVLAKTLSIEPVDTVVFYMDMRTWGKSFQQYYDAAEQEHGVRFERCRIHSLSQDNLTGDLVVRYVSGSGRTVKELFDMAVLSVGQRPGNKTEHLSRICELPLNAWGFFSTRPFSTIQTPQDGILAAGSATGLKDIAESVISASAAARSASQIITSQNRHIKPPVKEMPDDQTTKTDNAPFRDVSREPVVLFVGVCTCSGRLNQWVDPDALARYFSMDPEIIRVAFINQACTADGWQQMKKEISDCLANRVLIGACHPYVFLKKIRELAQTVRLDPSLMDVADIMAPVFRAVAEEKKDIQAICTGVFSALNSGAESMKRMEPINPQPIPIAQKTLVIGGGIAGMTAALAVADAGYGVDLIEKSDRLGGNLNWLHQTIEGVSLKDFLTDTVDAVEKHPLVNIFMSSRLISFEGSAGQFYSTIENEEKKAVDVTHGVLFMATGGHEAKTTAFGCGTHEAIITQKELEIRLAENQIDPAQAGTVVMIQCVDSRQGSRNYCSRVCCPTALKQARHLKQLNPEANTYILYRDMMTCGFSESFFTQARNDGVIFMTYDRENPPAVETGTGQITVSLTEPVLKMPVEISADLVVLATGIMPDFSDDLASLLGIQKDSHGFFQEAESKWRPLDAIKEGIFACGIVHSPRSATEAADTGRAAAQRAISLISKPAYLPDKTVAIVRHSLCSLCERCIETCPYGARMFNLDHTRIQINELMCQGCGACAAVCPNDASVLPGHSGRRMLGTIDAVSEQLHN